MATYKHQLNPCKKIQSVLTTSPSLKQVYKEIKKISIQ